jgi:glycosyltransferase involved in cell wall biosynthesis
MSDSNADPRSSFELADRILRAGHSLKRTVGAGVASEEATRILRAWLTQLDLGVGSDGLLATLEQPDRAEASRRSQPSVGAAVPRVAVVADDLTPGRGLANIVTQLREREVPGHPIDVLGTDVEILSQRRYDLVHVCGPGPAGIAALLLARATATPVVGSYHSDVRSLDGGDGAEQLDTMLASFYGQCRAVFSPSRFADRSLAALGVAPERIARWEPGVDRTRFSPACYGSEILPDAFNVLYAGRLASGKGLDLLVDAFQIARDRDPRLHLVLAGDGDGALPARLRSRLGTAATFLGWLDTEQLAGVYASAELLVFPSSTDTTGQAVLEAQASGLPVLAVDTGGAAELIESGRSGCLVAAEPAALGSAIRGLARRATLQDRLATGGLMAVRERTWERSLTQLASGYARALGEADAPHEVARAA